jgi:glutamate-1-semialdehyde 2,1-aminomutase
MSQVFRDLEAAMPASLATYERNRKVLAQEVVGTVWLPYAFYVKEAHDSRVVDADGNEYIDLTMAFGPLLLGHNPEVAVRAARETAELGLLLGLPNPYQGELGELLVEASACAEQVAFCNTGTEATLYAARVARATTGRTRVALFDGSYHGAHDLVLADAVLEPDPHRPGVKPRGHGIPAATLDQVLMLPYRDPAAFELIEAHKDELAMVMIEPVQSSNPRMDVGPFLRELRETCTRAGVLLCFDEVITGFRLAWGGAQEAFGVTPDLATYGKILGGGLPIGAVAGSRELMQVFNYFGGGSPIFAGGTFCGNPMSMRVGAAVVRQLRDHPEIYEDLERRSSRLANELTRFLEKEDYPAQLLNARSMFHLVFSREPVERGRHMDGKTMQLEHLFYAHLLKNGVVVPGIHIFFLSAAHTDEDVDRLIEAFQRSFRAVREEGAI